MLKGAWLYLFYHVIIYSFWFTCTVKWWVLFETKNKTLIFVPRLVALFSKQLYFTLTEQLQIVEESTATIKEPCRKNVNWIFIWKFAKLDQHKMQYTAGLITNKIIWNFILFLDG